MLRCVAVAIPRDCESTSVCLSYSTLLHEVFVLGILQTSIQEVTNSYPTGSTYSSYSMQLLAIVCSWLMWWATNKPLQKCLVLEVVFSTNLLSKYLYSPVQNYRKFSAVLGQMSAQSSICAAVSELVLA